MSKITIYVSFAYHAATKDLFLGVGHNSPAALKMARKNFHFKEPVYPESALFTFELDSSAPDFENKLELCILRSFEKMHRYFQKSAQHLIIEKNDLENKENILEFSEEEILVRVAEMRENSSLPIHDILYWGDCNLGYSGQSKFPKFLEDFAVFEGLIKKGFSYFSGKLKRILVSANTEIVNAAESKGMQLEHIFDFLPHLEVTIKQKDTLAVRALSPSRPVLAEEKKKDEPVLEGKSGKVQDEEIEDGRSAQILLGQSQSSDSEEEKSDIASQHISTTIEGDVPFSGSANVIRSPVGLSCCSSFFSRYKSSSASNARKDVLDPEEMSVNVHSRVSSRSGSSENSLSNTLLRVILPSKKPKTAITQQAEGTGGALQNEKVRHKPK